MRAEVRDNAGELTSIFEVSESLDPKAAQRAMLRFVRDSLAEGSNLSHKITITKESLSD